MNIYLNSSLLVVLKVKISFLSVSCPWEAYLVLWIELWVLWLPLCLGFCFLFLNLYLLLFSMPSIQFSVKQYNKITTWNTTTTPVVLYCTCHIYTSLITDFYNYYYFCYQHNSTSKSLPNSNKQKSYSSSSQWSPQAAESWFSGPVR